MPRTSITQLTSRAAFEQHVDTIAQLQLDLVAAKLARDEAKEAVLAAHEPLVKGLEAELKLLQTAAAAYADTNREQLFEGTAKSADTALARYGWRTGQPTLKAIGKQKTDELARELHEAGHVDLVEVTYTLNKKGLLRALKEGLAAVATRFKITQAERFYVEAKAEES